MPRSYTRRYVYIVCGAPSGRPDTRCSTCSDAHRQERRRLYQYGYHKRVRPSPKPVPQVRGDLPPMGTIITDDERIQCHVCGAWYGSLVSHIRTHGYDAARYKEAFGLARGASLLGPAAAAKQRRAALARNQGEVGRQAIAEIGPGTRPKGVEMRLQSRITRSNAGNPTG